MVVFGGGGSKDKGTGHFTTPRRSRYLASRRTGVNNLPRVVTLPRLDRVSNRATS